MIMGKHLIADIISEDDILKNSSEMCEIMRQSAINEGCNIVFERCHVFPDTNGYTAIIGLEESHISIHTWPEKKYCAVDIFLCGNKNPENMLNNMLKRFDKELKVNTRIFNRCIF